MISEQLRLLEGFAPSVKSAATPGHGILIVTACILSHPQIAQLWIMIYGSLTTAAKWWDTHAYGWRHPKENFGQ